MTKNFLLFLLFISTYSFACSCSRSSIKGSFSSSDAIFIGKVISVDSTKYDFNSNRVFAFTFEIKKEFKRREFNEVKNKKYYTTIYTPTSTMYGGCGRNFKLNETYLVYGYKNIIGTSTNYCTRTNDLKLIAKNELDSLKNLQIDLFKTKENEIEVDYLTDYSDFKPSINIDNLNNYINESKEKERNYISIIACMAFVIAAMFTYIFIKRKG
ncbi:Tissue inhibitor of metalloproteinase [Chishuiella changwenlii]|uniref:Tissue inhibitor of metalloproteinase n=1 Tax=Chishuiella changwenlii TaxID=1434701 RepID=A0A1M6U7F0_9FLAO|nr:hypothetical protein [Chishuiella changwenlii]GGE99710.1 hypothetical protein GCM10010984_16600 [Chishuiella changwenlii]SHK65093.1 Tissue inhibitor of metalloproteinase [Chishuiella changwenlii]